MASTYNYLGIEKMATGENAGTWGTKTNTNLDIIQQAASGYHSQTIAGGAQTTALLMTDGDSTSTADSLTNAARNMVIELTGAITGNQIVTFPTATEGLKVVFNNTSGAYTVQLKGASDSGSGTTFTTTSKDKKLVYMSGTDLVEVNIAGSVTASSTTTFTNKTFTAPKYADGGYVADANGNENLVWGTTTSAVNEFKMQNAATGNGPTLTSQGDDSNVDINITPKGTGDVLLAADTVTVGDAAAAATIRSSGAGTLTVTTGGATDLILSTNNGTTSGTITITDAANGAINITPNGTGNVQLYADEVTIGDSGATATLTSNGTGDLLLNTNSGTNSSAIQITDAANGDITFTNNGSGNVVFNDAAYNPETSLTDATTITWDAQAMPITKVTLTANRILAAPTNGAAGQFISLLIIQDAGGTNTLTWNAVFEFPSETAPTLTSTGDLADLFVFRYHNSKWLQVGATLALTVA